MQKGFSSVVIVIVLGVIALGAGVGFRYFQDQKISQVPFGQVAEPEIVEKKVFVPPEAVVVPSTGSTNQNISTTTQISAPPSKPIPIPTNPAPSLNSSPLSRIDSCGTISTAGNYFLSGDLTNTKSEPCISVQNVSSISIDCQNHTITSKNEDYNIYVKGSSDFRVSNCKLVSSVSLPSPSTQHVLRIEDSKHGEIHNNTVGGSYASISGSSFITVQDSTFNNQLNVYKSNNVIIKDSDFINGVDSITLQEGSNNSVVSNFIDGKSDGVFRGFDNSIGADDGIVIKDETGDLILGNTLQNFFDCAIENAGYMFDAKIIGNKASNAGVCFLGGWYYSSVKGIIVRDNVVSNMPTLFYFFRVYDLKPNEQYVYFQNNTFENNKMSNPKTDTSFSLASRMVFDGAAVPMQNHVLGNNVLRNNDFTKLLQPLRITPANIVIDAGGNICSGAEEEAKGGGDSIPFNCN